MATGAAQEINAPLLSPPANGLLNSVTVIDHTDEHWANGLTFVPEDCDDALVYDPCSVTAVDGAAHRKASLTFLPFVVEAYDRCSTFAWQSAEYEGRARRALAARESKAVEKEFAIGAVIPANTHFQDNTNTVKLLSSVAQGLRTGLQALVQGIADRNLGRGVIHARPYLVTAWSALNLLRWENGKLYTLTGSLVVPGSGYTGAAPDGSAPVPASEWAYATGNVEVHRGPVEVFAGAIEGQGGSITTKNEAIVRAQRFYSVVFNACAVVGVNINPTSAT